MNTQQLSLLEPLSEQVTAEEYKASLPRTPNGLGIKWSIETYATYVNLLYPHITVPLDQEWQSNRVKLRHVCEKHGEYLALPRRILLKTTGCQCKGCQSDQKSASAGTMRCRKSTPEEREKARLLRSEGYSYPEIGRILGRPNSTINNWLNPEIRINHLELSRKWREENRKRRAEVVAAYYQTPRGKAKRRQSNYLRRLLETNVPEVVFLDDKWCEVDRDATYKIWSHILLPQEEREAIDRLCEEAVRLSEETGIEHHVDHVQPLSRGGEHASINLQILPAEENLEKGNTFRVEDQALLAKRLFNL